MGSKRTSRPTSPAPGSPVRPRSPAQTNKGSPQVDLAKGKATTVVQDPTRSASSSQDGEAAQDIDDDPLFEFEEDLSKLLEPATVQPQKYIREEESESPSSRFTKKIIARPPLATVGSLPIRRPAPVIPMLAQSVGSYRGNTLSFAPIANPELYNQIASMGDVPHFVGSVDGRTGPDEADMNNYRATLAKFSGAPGASARSWRLRRPWNGRKLRRLPRQQQLLLLPRRRRRHVVVRNNKLSSLTHVTTRWYFASRRISEGLAEGIGVGFSKREIGQTAWRLTVSGVVRRCGLIYIYISLSALVSSLGCLYSIGEASILIMIAGHLPCPLREAWSARRVV